MKKMIIAAAALCMLAVASCKKGDDNPSQRDRLTTGKWRLTAGTVTYNLGGISQTQDIYSSLEPCEKDNLAIFKTDDTAVTDEGETKCNANDPQQETAGPWTLYENDTRLNYQGINWKVVTLDASTLKLQLDSTAQGISITGNTTFTHVN